MMPIFIVINYPSQPMSEELSNEYYILERRRQKPVDHGLSELSITPTRDGKN
jgi:hypothetical protein